MRKASPLISQAYAAKICTEKVYFYDLFYDPDVLSLRAFYRDRDLIGYSNCLSL